MRAFLLVIVVVFICSLNNVIFAGNIAGHITNSKDGSPIPGAEVIITGTNMGASADSLGYYRIENVPAGTYNVKSESIGFGSVEKSVTVANNSYTLQLDFSLFESAVELSEVVINSRANRELETTARQTEKESGNVVNVISAQTIQRSTDRTAADALQRVSGMSILRDHGGEGQYVVMRGLAQQYNNTLVDGIKIPSPESKDRFVPMDIFPSGLFESIKVSKSLTPETAGDAIGGSTDLALREAPDKFIFSMSASTGTSSSLFGNSFSSFDANSVAELDPERLHGTVSDEDPTTLIKQRYNPSTADFSISSLKFADKPAPPDVLYSAIAGDRFLDGKIGLIAAGSYQNTNDRVQTDFYSVNSNINKVDDAGHLLPYASTYDSQIYFTNKIRTGALLKTDFIAGQQDEFSATYLFVRKEEDQARHALQIQIDGSRGAHDLTYTHRAALRTQTVSSVSLSGDNFKNSSIHLRWILNYTDAVQDRPDEAQYSVTQNYDINGNLQPFQGLGVITHSWRKNDDNQYLGKLDAIIHLTNDGSHTLQTGIEIQKLKRANYQDDYKLNPAIINGHTQPFTSLDSAQVIVFGYGTTSGTSVYGYQNYKASELLTAGYFQYTAILGRFQILGGLRWEQAQDKYYTSAGNQPNQQSDVKMVNFMPGIHFRYEFTQHQIARFSLTQSISRPSYFDLVPAVDRSDQSSTTGNPNLRPATSTNIDLRYEFYPNPSDVFSLGVYYKKIKDPIEDQFQSVGVVLSTTKANGDPATVYGIEAVASKHLGGFGITANYSYVYSRITSTKQVTTVDAFTGDLHQTFYQQERPLQSQSPQIGNVIVSYENKDWGTSVNISYNFTGKRLRAVSRLDGYDTYEDATHEFDFSGEQEILPNLTFSIKLINLFNAPAVTEVASGDYLIHDPIVILKDNNKIRGSIGLHYSL